MKRLLVAGLVSVSSTLGCAPSPNESMRVLATTAPHTSPNRDERIIARLRTRDDVLTITATPGGPRYAVATSDGASIARDLTVEQLGASHPALGDLVRAATASTYLEARYDEAHDARRPRDLRR